MHSLHSSKPIFPRLPLISPLMQSGLEPSAYASLLPSSPSPYKREIAEMNSTSYDLLMHSLLSPTLIYPRLLPPHPSTCAVSPPTVLPTPPQLSRPFCASQRSFVYVSAASRLPCSLLTWHTLSSFTTHQSLPMYSPPTSSPFLCIPLKHLIYVHVCSLPPMHLL